MSLFRRTLAGASVLAALAGSFVATPASADSSSATCNHATSTRLLTAQEGEYKLWVEKVTPLYYGADEYHICWKLSDVTAGDLVLRSAFRGDPTPTFSYVVNDATCPDFFTLQDPIQLVTELRANPTDFCVGVDNNRAIRIRLGVPSVHIPWVELWLDKDTAAGEAFCRSSALVNALYTQCRYSSYTSVNVLNPSLPL